MRLLIYEDVEHRLNERDWKKLLNRFDVRKAKLNIYGYYSVNIKSICSGRSYKCNKCPLSDPHKKINSCTYLYGRIIGDVLFSYVYLFDNAIFWDPKFDKEVRQALQSVREVLSTASKI